VKPVQWLGSLCEIVCKPFGINPPIYRRRVDFFTKTRHFDLTKAQRDLGYQPSRPLQEEVTEAVNWYQSHGWL
jgi:nucleoside-diphosphate-sugar epimerase